MQHLRYLNNSSRVSGKLGQDHLLELYAGLVLQLIRSETTMTNMHTVRLPDELTKRLATLARATKRTKSYFIREAIERCIEDLEDAYLAETAYEDFLKSGKKSIPLEDVERKLGLAD